MVRSINIEEITKNIREMCIEANHYLSSDMDAAMKQAEQTEKAPLGKQILGQLQENLKIARMCIWKADYSRMQSMNACARATPKVS